MSRIVITSRERKFKSIGYIGCAEQNRQRFYITNRFVKRRTRPQPIKDATRLFNRVKVAAVVLVHIKKVLSPVLVAALPVLNALRPVNRIEDVGLSVFIAVLWLAKAARDQIHAGIVRVDQNAASAPADHRGMPIANHHGSTTLQILVAVASHQNFTANQSGIAGAAIRKTGAVNCVVANPSHHCRISVSHHGVVTV